MPSPLDVTAMRVIIVRHASAGNKRHWSGPDLLRPLDDVGGRQAAGLIDTLAGLRIGRLVSSPALRCVQTLEPLAEHTGLHIETSTALAPDADARALIAGLEDAALADAVLCTHREVMQPMLRHMRRRHVAIGGDPGPRGWLLRKGTAWQLNIANHGAIVKLEAFAPPR